MDERSGLNACNCYATRRAARHITRLYERHLSAAQLTSAQFSILVLLEANDSQTMSALAKELAMDRTTLLRAIKPLQRDELVVAGSSADDPRRKVFSLSAAGERKVKQAMKLWQAAQKEFETLVGAARASRMREDLQTVVTGN